MSKIPQQPDNPLKNNPKSPKNHFTTTNPRYGSAMALGIACAGTGLKEALALLDPLTSDPVNFVRQGALIASAMVLIQHNENTAPKVAHFRQLYAKVCGGFGGSERVRKLTSTPQPFTKPPSQTHHHHQLIADKHEDVMAKFGAILAQGIIDAGGRNCTISLQSRTGHTNMETVVGLLVFLQFWYWYPLTHFLSLALTPSALIALNGDLNMPKVRWGFLGVNFYEGWVVFRGFLWWVVLKN